MRLTKEEFQTLLMLYVSNVDGNRHPEEIRLILENIQPEVYTKMLRMFKKMNDTEVLQCIEENKQFYAATIDDHQCLMNDLQALIEADGRLLSIEEYIFQSIAKILE